jgi:hypothetical protein
MILEITSPELTQEPVSSYDRANSVMEESPILPRDRRKSSRRVGYRRNNRVAVDENSRRQFRRSNFDRRGMQYFFTTPAAPDAVLEYLCQFNKHWTLSGLDMLSMKSSVLDRGKWCLVWDVLVEDVALSWRSMATKFQDSKSIIIEPLGGDLEVFDGRVWVEPHGSGSRVNFNLVASFGLGAFERLVGNIFKQKCQKVFHALVAKWKAELSRLS